jgi:hypothetical protein
MKDKVMDKFSGNFWTLKRNSDHVMRVTNRAFSPILFSCCWRQSWHEQKKLWEKFSTLISSHREPCRALPFKFHAEALEAESREENPRKGPNASVNRPENPHQQRSDFSPLIAFWRQHHLDSTTTNDREEEKKPFFFS